MPTNNYVESSFWNFDALFQPQQHPARDAHDTFFMTKPAQTKDLPEEYLLKVKKMHEEGGSGSIGYRSVSAPRGSLHAGRSTGRRYIYYFFSY